MNVIVQTVLQKMGTLSQPHLKEITTLLMTSNSSPTLLMPTTTEGLPVASQAIKMVRSLTCKKAAELYPADNPWR